MPATATVHALRVPRREITPMPVTDEQLQRLRDVLAWALLHKHDKGHTAGAVITSLSDALGLAIRYLEHPNDQQNVMRWILGALFQSVTLVGKNHDYISIREPQLAAWAIKQIRELEQEGVLKPVENGS